MEALIFLTGFMGSGKSTVGRLLARRLRRRFVDLDREIERREGRSIPELFAEGEASFRAAETRALKAVRGPAVVALGGGALLHNAVEGALIKLTCAEPELWRRLKPQLAARPLLKGGRPAMRRLLKARRYPGRAFSTTRKPPQRVAKEIERWLRAS